MCHLISLTLDELPMRFLSFGLTNSALAEQRRCSGGGKTWLSFRTFHEKEWASINMRKGKIVGTARLRLKISKRPFPKDDAAICDSVCKT